MNERDADPFEELALPSSPGYGKRKSGKGEQESVSEQASTTSNRSKRSALSLADAAGEVFRPVLLLHRKFRKKGEVEDGEPEEVEIDFQPREFTETIKTAIKQFRGAARRAGYSNDDASLAEYAIVAFVDDLVLQSNWSGREEWTRNPLWKQLREAAPTEQQTRPAPDAGGDAGVVFFDKLEAISPSSRGVLEVFYLCLTLGFEGKYRDRGDGARGELDKKISAVRSKLGTPRIDPEAKLFESAYQRFRAIPIQRVVRGRLWLITGAASIFIAVLTYVVYQLLIEATFSRAISAILGGE